LETAPENARAGVEVQIELSKLAVKLNGRAPRLILNPGIADNFN